MGVLGTGHHRPPYCDAACIAHAKTKLSCLMYILILLLIHLRRISQECAPSSKHQGFPGRAEAYLGVLVSSSCQSFQNLIMLQQSFWLMGECDIWLRFRLTTAGALFAMLDLLSTLEAPLSVSGDWSRSRSSWFFSLGWLSIAWNSRHCPDTQSRGNAANCSLEIHVYNSLRIDYCESVLPCTQFHTQ